MVIEVPEEFIEYTFANIHEILAEHNVQLIILT